jgi:hypothetical protein
MFGIDLDDQASNYYQEKNLVLGGGFKVQWTRGNKYLNNISTATDNGNVQFHGTWGSAAQPSYHYGARNIFYATSACVYQTCCGSNASQVAGTKTFWDSNMVYSPAGTPNVSGWNACGSQTNTWSEWTGQGLDAHSSNQNPTFVSTTKTWTGRSPAYLPVGDYNPTNTTAINAIKFQTFAMDSFGIMGKTPGISTGVLEPQQSMLEMVDVGKAITVNLSARMLFVSYGGDYHVSITSATGRTLAMFNGKGCSSFALDTKRMASGLYFAVVHTKSGMVSRRFIVT